MNRRRNVAPLVVLALFAPLASGCGGSGGSASGTSSRKSSVADPHQQLQDAVREAIREDHAESVRSLWTNRVPAHPVATAGPALAQLRQSVADRRRAGVRVRSLSQRLRILSTRVDPSYETATAFVRDDQRVQLTKSDGRSVGKPLAGHEHVRIVLHRGRGDRFVVWRVEVLRR